MISPFVIGIVVRMENFQIIHPSRFITFSPGDVANVLNPFPLRIAVLDSPIEAEGVPRVAILYVPKNRQNDWLFNTKSGQMELLFSFTGLHRLILVGEAPDATAASLVYDRPPEPQLPRSIRDRLCPALMPLFPRETLNGPTIGAILKYDDHILSIIALETTTGPMVGDIVVEDVELESGSAARVFRRRLRFNKRPMVEQTIIKIVPSSPVPSDSTMTIGHISFNPDLSLLVCQYLEAMVSGLVFVANDIENLIRDGFMMPRAMCLGAGGGSLLTFLRNQLGLYVLGVEIDEEVLKAGKNYFGLVEGQFMKLVFADSVDFMETIGNALGEEDDYVMTSRFQISIDDAYIDVMMIDLDCYSLADGIIPPWGLLETNILQIIKQILPVHGVLILHFQPSNSAVHENVCNKVLEVFPIFYRVTVRESIILVVKMDSDSVTTLDGENHFLGRLRSTCPGQCMDAAYRTFMNFLETS